MIHRMGEQFFLIGPDSLAAHNRLPRGARSLILASTLPPLRTLPSAQQRQQEGKTPSQQFQQRLLVGRFQPRIYISDPPFSLSGSERATK
ncbi:MAG: hypothetical protein ABSF71_19385 [Terriglobia bacterium]